MPEDMNEAVSDILEAAAIAYQMTSWWRSRKLH